MKYEIIWTSQFTKDVKRVQKRAYNLELLQKVIDTLASGEGLAPKYKDHALKGNYKGYRECHVQPDWLLVYKYENETLLLTMYRTGTHSDLF